MSIKEDVALLKAIPLFAKVDASQLNVLAFSLERQTLDEGDVLFRDGDAGKGGYVVARGEISLKRQIGNREETITVGQGALIGEQSMFADVPYRGTARAATGNTVVCRISRELFYKVAEEFPELANAAIKAVNDKLNATLAELRQAQQRL